jgi:hypothetical protein
MSIAAFEAFSLEKTQMKKARVDALKNFDFGNLPVSPNMETLKKTKKSSFLVNNYLHQLESSSRVVADIPKKPQKKRFVDLLFKQNIPKSKRPNQPVNWLILSITFNTFTHKYLLGGFGHWQCK